MRLSSSSVDERPCTRSLKPPDDRLKLTGNPTLQISVLPFRHETEWFQLPGHPGRQLSREPLGGNQR
jgi:hypothetical protein